MGFFIRLSVVIGLFLLLSLGPFLLLFYLEYKPTLDWNNNAIQTTCVIVSHEYLTSICRYYEGGGGGGVEKRQARSPYTCIDGIITVVYGNNYIANISIINGFIREVQDYLDEVYKVGSSKTCWYQRNSPKHVELELIDPNIYYAGAMIFLLGGIIIVAVWTAIEIASAYKNRINRRRNYQSL